MLRRVQPSLLIRAQEKGRRAMVAGFNEVGPQRFVLYGKLRDCYVPTDADYPVGILLGYPKGIIQSTFRLPGCYTPTVLLRMAMVETAAAAHEG